MTTKSLLEILPKNIVESEELSLAAKKMLGALVDYFTHSQAKTTQRLFMSNEKICETANFGKSTLFKATRELEMFDLIEKKSGKARTQGQKSEASEYILHINNFIKPLRKKTFEAMMFMFPKSWLQNSGNPLQDCSTVQNSTVQSSTVQSREVQSREETLSEEEVNAEKSREDIERKDESKMSKSRETPIGTTITTPITTSITTPTSTSMSTSTPIESSNTNSIEKPTITEKPIEASTINETETTNSNDKVEQTDETDEREELLQFFIETVNLDVERLYDSFFSHFKYGIESNTELGKELIDYVFDKLSHTNYELYRKVCEQVETVFKLEKPKYLVNTNTSTSSNKKVDEESSIISEPVHDEMPF